MAARVACIPFSLLRAGACYAWARSLFGARAGLAALTMWCFSPWILGHGALATSDVPGAAMAVAAIFAWHSRLKGPSWLGALIAGVAQGAALSVKYTNLLLLPAIVVVTAVQLCLTENWRLSRRGLYEFALLLLCALAKINAVYGGDGSLTRLGEVSFRSRWLSGASGHDFGDFLGANRFAGSVLAKIPVPLPADFLLGIDEQRLDCDRRRLLNVRGTWKSRGWWWYDLYGLLVKEPLGHLLLGSATI